MLKAVLIAIISVLAVVVAIRLAYAIILLSVMLISALLRGVVAPLLRGIWLFVVRPVFWTIGQIIALPFRLAAALLRPFTAGQVSSLVLGPVCRNGACRCANPTEARFCRRCGATVAIV